MFLKKKPCCWKTHHLLHC